MTQERSTEQSAIAKNQHGPVTTASLINDFKRLGVQPEMVLLVHSSLSSLGWVCGGPVAVILALEEVLGPEGTLVMPTHSTGLTDPDGWANPPVPQEWHDMIRRTIPAYDPHLTRHERWGLFLNAFVNNPASNGVTILTHPLLHGVNIQIQSSTTTNWHLVWGNDHHCPASMILMDGSYSWVWDTATTPHSIWQSTARHLKTNGLSQAMGL